MSRVIIVANRVERATASLTRAWSRLGIDVQVLPPAAASTGVEAGDIVVCTLDVLRALDGIEPGMNAVERMTECGIRVINPPSALRAAHDKLETAHRLAAAGIPHPRSVHVRGIGDAVELDFPIVLKPRHGSRGRDVYRCTTDEELRKRLAAVQGRSWFKNHGAIVQELVEPSRQDIRLIVANARVVGGAARTAAPGEWRSNVSLGGRVHRVYLDDAARRLAVAACHAIGADFAGVDLIHSHGHGYTVIDLNGAVDFDEGYALPGTSLYREIAVALGLTGRRRTLLRITRSPKLRRPRELR